MSAEPGRLVEHELRGNVAVLTLNRPDRRNAMVPEMMAELANQLRQASSSVAAKAVVLTGAPPAFCVGADLKWVGAAPDAAQAIAAQAAQHHEAVRAMLQAQVPIVAAVNGPAAGGGMSLALAADYRLASASASFTAAYFRLALPPDGGNSVFLTRMLGPSRAMELLVTNRTLAAQEALSLGLVGQVTLLEDLLDAACAVAASMADVPIETLLATRKLLASAASQPIEAQLDAEEQAMRSAAQRPAFHQALQAFLDKAKG